MQVLPSTNDQNPRRQPPVRRSACSARQHRTVPNLSKFRSRKPWFVRTILEAQSRRNSKEVEILENSS